MIRSGWRSAAVTATALPSETPSSGKRSCPLGDRRGDEVVGQPVQGQRRLRDLTVDAGVVQPEERAAGQVLGQLADVRHDAAAGAVGDSQRRTVSQPDERVNGLGSRGRGAGRGMDLHVADARH